MIRVLPHVRPRNSIIVLATMVIAAIQFSPVRASELYGWTRFAVGGKVDFVSIAPSGQATLEFQIPIPSGYEARSLTYDPTERKFYGVFYNGVAGDNKLVEINHLTTASSIHSFSSIPATSPPQTIIGHQGLEYVKDVGLVTAGYVDDDDALFLVTPGGVATQTELVATLVEDQDELVSNSLLGGLLYVHDTNHPTFPGYTISGWHGAFDGILGLPTLTAEYHGSAEFNNADLAILPLQGLNRIYVSTLSGLHYYDMTSQAEVNVGNFNYGAQIWGIAAVPEPSSGVIALLASGSMLVAAKRFKLGRKS